MKGKLKASAASALVLLAVAAWMAPGASANFTSNGYPATVSGSSTGDTFTMFGSTVRCTNNSFGGTLSEAKQGLTIKPNFAKCLFGQFRMTVNFTSCDLLFTTTTGGAPELHVKCDSPNDAIDLTVYASHNAHTAGNAICHYSIPEQTVQGHAYTNNAGGTVTLSGSIGEISATQTRTSFVCPAGTETSSAVYDIQEGGIVLSGDNGPIEVH